MWMSTLNVHPGMKPFKCEIFDYKLPLMTNLTNHTSSVHEDKKPIECSIGNCSLARSHLNVLFVITNFRKNYDWTEHLKVYECKKAFKMLHLLFNFFQINLILPIIVFNVH